MPEIFSFPNPVNEKAARVVAGAVFATSVVILTTGAYWLLVPVAYGFWARVRRVRGHQLAPVGRALTTALVLRAPELPRGGCRALRPPPGRARTGGSPRPGSPHRRRSSARARGQARGLRGAARAGARRAG